MRTVVGAALALLLAGTLVAGRAPGVDVGIDVDPWQPFADADVVEIVTSDPDGDPRETKVWIVIVDGSGYVRTNDSRWLANIRRGSAVALRVDEWESRVVAVEVDDPATTAAVEAAFKAKYGAMQRLMSFFRVAEPTVLRLTLTERIAGTGAGSADRP